MDQSTDSANQLGSSDINIIFEGRPACMGSCTQYFARTHWRITSKYIERETGVCCTSIENIQLLRVKDIAYRRGTCCCGCCGTIIVYSSDETCPEMHIAGIPGGKEVYQKLRDAYLKLQSGARLEIQA